jgi:hypothetical protein
MAAELCLDGVTLCPELRKPFDVLVEGLISEKSGEGGIRTRGGVLPPRRFSKAVLSATQPPLQIPLFQGLTSSVGGQV